MKSKFASCPLAPISRAGVACGAACTDSRYSRASVSQSSNFPKPAWHMQIYSDAGQPCKRWHCAQRDLLLVSVGDLWSGDLNHTSVNSLLSTVIKTPASARASHCSFTLLAHQCGGGCQPHNSHRTQTNGRWGKEVARRQELACQRNTCLGQAVLSLLRNIWSPYTL